MAPQDPGREPLPIPDPERPPMPDPMPDEGPGDPVQ